MPSGNVDSLSNITALQLGSNFKTCFDAHLESTCNYCASYKTMEKCPGMSALKNEIDSLPEYATDVLYQKVQMRYPKMEEFRTCTSEISSRSPERRRMYLISWLFDRCDLKFKFDCKCNHEQDFINSFGKFLVNVHFVSNCNLSCLQISAQYENSLQRLRLKNSLTEDILEVIGRNCNSIKEIHGKVLCNEYNPLLLFKLLFKDPETQRIKNKCCNTLEALNGFFTEFRICEYFDELEKQTIMNEALNILFLNVPNFKSIGEKEFQLDEVLLSLDSETGTTTRIQEASCHTELSVKELNKMRIVCPELSRLFIRKEQPDEVLQALHSSSGITDLIFCTPVPLLYTHLLATNWISLKSLLLFAGTIQELKLHVFATVLPNLESLDVNYCENISWDSTSHFESLRTISLAIGTGVGKLSKLDWFQSFRRTIVLIDLKLSVTVSADQVDILISEEFPNLKFVSIFPSGLHRHFVDSARDTCPKLKEFIHERAYPYNFDF